MIKIKITIMNTYFNFIKPTFKQQIYLITLFLFMVVIKIIFLHDIQFIHLFSGYLGYWVGSTCEYLYCKYKGYVD
jgi:hypothetical protein